MNNSLSLYLWNTGKLNDQEIDLLSQKLPNSERQRANLMVSKRRRQFILGRCLLRDAFLSQNNLSLPEELEINEKGKPMAVGFPGFNISHSKNWMGLAIGNKQNIGLDVEAATNSRDIQVISKKYGSPDEIKFLKNLSKAEKENTFYKIWSLKESYAKHMGEGLSHNLQKLRFDFLKNKIIEVPLDKSCTFYYLKTSDLHISICSDNAAAEVPKFCEVSFQDGTVKYEKKQGIHFEQFVLAN